MLRSSSCDYKDYVCAPYGLEGGNMDKRTCTFGTVGDRSVCLKRGGEKREKRVSSCGGTKPE